MKILAVIISLTLLLLATGQDIKEKKFYMVYPIIMFAVNIIERVYTTGIIVNISELILSFGIVAYSVISDQKLGMGDAFIFVALLPLCNIYGVIRIFTDGLLLLCIWKWIKRNKEKSKSNMEIAFVPFITAGFGLWIFI